MGPINFKCGAYKSYVLLFMVLFANVAFPLNGWSSPKREEKIRSLLLQVKQGEVGGLPRSEAHELAALLENKLIWENSPYFHRSYSIGDIVFESRVGWSAAMTKAVLQFLEGVIAIEMPEGGDPQEQAWAFVQSFEQKLMEAHNHLTAAQKVCQLWPQCPGVSSLLQALSPLGYALDTNPWLMEGHLPAHFGATAFYLMDHTVGINPLDKQFQIVSEALKFQDSVLLEDLKFQSTFAMWHEVIANNTTAQGARQCLMEKGFSEDEWVSILRVLGGRHVFAMAFYNRLRSSEKPIYLENPQRFVENVEKAVRVLGTSNNTRKTFFDCMGITDNDFKPNGNYEETLKLLKIHNHTLKEQKQRGLWPRWVAASGSEEEAKKNFLILFSWHMKHYHPIEEKDLAPLWDNFLDYAQREIDVNSVPLAQIIEVLEILLKTYSHSNLTIEFYENLEKMEAPHYERFLETFLFIFGDASPQSLQKSLGLDSHPQNHAHDFARELHFRRFLKEDLGLIHALEPDWGSAKDPTLAFWKTLSALGKAYGDLEHSSPDIHQLDREANILSHYRTVVEKAALAGLKGQYVNTYASGVFRRFQDGTLPWLPDFSQRMLLITQVKKGLARYDKLWGLSQNQPGALAFLKRFLYTSETVKIPFVYAPLLQVGTPDHVFELARTAVEHHGYKALEGAEEWGISATQFQDLVQRLSPFLMQSDPERVLSELVGEDLQGAIPFEEFISHLECVAQKNPDLVPPLWLAVLKKTFKKKDVWMGLLGQMHALNNRGVAFEGLGPFEILSLGLGWGAVPLATYDLNAAPIALLYQTALQIQRRLPHPAFETIRLAPVLFKDRKLKVLLPILEDLRTLFFLKGGHRMAWSHLLEGLMPVSGGQITAENAGSVGAHVKGLLEKEEKILFGSTHRGSAFSNDEFVSLAQEWGQDLDPVFVLISRLKALGYTNEVSLVAKVLKKSMEGHFELYKFYGDDDEDAAVAHQQMANVLTKYHQRLWINPTFFIEYVDEAKMAKTGANEADPPLYDVVATNVLPHSGYPFRHVENQFPGLWAHGKTLLQSLNVSDAPYSIKKLTAAVRQWRVPQERHLGVLVMLAIDALAATEGQPHRLVPLARLTQQLLKHEDREYGAFLEPVKSQLLEDLGDILKLGTSLNTGGASQALLVTTTFHHPKLLLMIGDLVKASSCQNYRTGGLIFTLPATVIDAHTQGLGTWALKEKDFLKATDYNSVVKALQGGEQVSVAYNGRGFVFSWDSQFQPVATRPLPHAHNRQILRLGQYPNKKPGVALERPYQAPHWALRRMHRNHQKVLEMVKAKLGIEEQKKPLTIFKSRNPSGTYSDGAGGVQKSSFVL